MPYDNKNKKPVKKAAASKVKAMAMEKMKKAKGKKK